MKTFFFKLTVIVLLVSVLPLRVLAEGEKLSWFCAHEKNHVQPKVDHTLSFVTELGAYYIDRRHTEMKDPDKVVYLTFDVGYENGNVERVLDVLKEEQVPGAFFILANVIRKNPELVRRMADDGHTVGNHTLRHKDMSCFSEDEFLEELQGLEALYRECTGYVLSSYYRPPEGRFNRTNLETASKYGYKTIFWSFAYPDWDNEAQLSPEKAKQIIFDNVHNGAVLLLHPTSRTNADILEDVIERLKQDGFRFGTLDELTREAVE